MKSKRALLGERVRFVRKRLSLSQEGLAERCGLHRTYIGGIERGERNVSLDNIYKIARALEIHVGEFFDDSQYS